MNHEQSGASLVELMVVLVILALAVGVATASLQPAASPLQTGAAMLESLFGAARARAMATTSAYRVRAADARTITVENAASCADTVWTPDTRLDLELPEEVTMTATDWSVCFGSRGVSNANVLVSLTHPDTGMRQVEVLIGGSTRVVR